MLRELDALGRRPPSLAGREPAELAARARRAPAPDRRRRRGLRGHHPAGARRPASVGGWCSPARCRRSASATPTRPPTSCPTCCSRWWRVERSPGPSCRCWPARCRGRWRPGPVRAPGRGRPHRVGAAHLGGRRARAARAAAWRCSPVRCVRLAGHRRAAATAPPRWRPGCSSCSPRRWCSTASGIVLAGVLRRTGGSCGRRSARCCRSLVVIGAYLAFAAHRSGCHATTRLALPGAAGRGWRGGRPPASW